MRAFKTLEDLDLGKQRVLLRADLNVPVEGGKVTDATRIERIVPTIREIIKHDGKAILISHFGRPKGKVDKQFSLEQIVPAVAEAAGHPPGFIDTDWVDVERAKRAIDSAPDGSILVLENTRFHAGEEENDAALAARMASLGDVYVNDAFSAAHRAHASTEGLARLLPAAAGLAMQAELEALEKGLGQPQRPVIALVGGAKVSTKIELLEHLITKVDALINMVGELVITQSMLGDIGEHFGMERLMQLREGLAQLDRTTRELQESVMRIRMLPIAAVFNRFPRVVRDLEHKLGKRVKLELHGESTEVDKTVLEKIGDPMVHLVRNAIDHGLESPGDRIAAGKPEVGVLRLDARHEGGNVVVEVSDDGTGLRRERIVEKAVQRGLAQPGQELGDEEVAELIFQAGFSTNAEATDLSGRGVGMDVVRRNVSDLGGSVSVRSREGKGSTFTIVLPLTLAIIEGLTTEVGGERYIVPLVSIVESLQLKAPDVRHVAGGGELFHFREDWLPLVRLHDAFGCADAVTRVEQGIVIVVEAGGRRVGLLVDALLGQQQAVIKSLESHYRRIEGISGATIASDGSVALIVDVDGVVRVAGRRRAA